MKLLLAGCGDFGKHYLRLLKDSGMLYAAVVKTERHAREIEAVHGVKAYTDINHADLDKCDGVIISTPCVTHAELVKKILPIRPVLCEKPLAMNSRDIKDIMSIEKESKNKLMVGHIYRFNKSLYRMKEILSEKKPKEVKIRFLKGRKKDCDAMHEFLHGFDMMISLFENYNLSEKKIRYDASGDAEYARLVYDCGIRCITELGWESEEKVRELSFFYDDEKITCDFVAQEINGKSYYEEPLKKEIERFADIIKGKDLYYPCSAEALEIEKMIEEARR